MPITFQKKQKLVKELGDKIKNSKSVVFADFTGLASDAMSGLRKKMRRENVFFKVIRKTLFKRALRSAGLKEAAENKVPGQLSVAISNDEVGAAKAVSSFIKDTKTENLAILGGILEQKFLTKAEMADLAKVPSKEELLGSLVGTIQAPVSEFVNVLRGNIRNLILVLSQIKK